MTAMGPSPQPRYDLGGKRVWVAGHTGLVGSALVRRLRREDCALLLVGHDDLDLTRQSDTEAWMQHEMPQVIFVAAARVGGILANSRYPVDFLHDNLMIGANVIRTAHAIGVERLLWLGSSCIYPRLAPQPIAEDALLTGPLEPTNEAYAIAKIAGLKLAEACQRQYGDAYFTVMPTNVYGPNDNFDLDSSHVLPALIRKIHDARQHGQASVDIWGSGRPLREFIHVDDLADACVFIARNGTGCAPINVGTGQELSIGDLARLVAEVVGYQGEFRFDTAKPDGAPRKLLDSSHINVMGWSASIDLRDGIRDLYRYWLTASPPARLSGHG
jgi:GDP-L-fucose synthase